MDEQRHWERIRGYVSENRVDARWILCSNLDDKAYGSLRIVSHPDLKPGYLRAFSSFVTSRRPKTKEEIKQSIKDYQMKVPELEVYSVDEHIITSDLDPYEAPAKELEETYNIKIFEQ